jgi:hypothetical protein
LQENDETGDYHVKWNKSIPQNHIFSLICEVWGGKRMLWE